MTVDVSARFAISIRGPGGG